jgi:hypothetical protein
MKYLSIGAMLCVFCLLPTHQAIAGPIKQSAPPPPCNTNVLTLNHMSASADNTAQNLLLSSYTASTCAGLFGEPKNIGSLHDANPNIGTLGDGLLNGEGGWLSSTQFITADQLMDLGANVGFPDANPSIADDPGWISLAKFDLKPEGGFSANYQAIDWLQYLDLDDVLDINFTCTSGGTSCSSGNWSLATSLDVIEKVQAALGNRSTFDHLAFVFKAGTNWAVYDFNFTDIFYNELVVLQNGNIPAPFNTPFTFGGTFNTGDFNKNISHFAVWARDPFSTASVPEPAPLFLFGFGLVAVGLLRRRV